MSSEEQVRRQMAYNLMIDIRNLVHTKVLEVGDPLDPLWKAATVHVLVLLNDLLQLAALIGQRIDFTDDVGEMVGEPKDVTSLVANVRAAACHIGSRNSWTEEGLGLSMVVASGKCRQMIKGVPHSGCEYEDDWALIFGRHRIYYRRHILRAFFEAKAAFGITVWHDDPSQFLPDSR